MYKEAKTVDRGRKDGQNERDCRFSREGLREAAPAMSRRLRPPLICGPPARRLCRPCGSAPGRHRVWEVIRCHSDMRFPGFKGPPPAQTTDLDFFIQLCIALYKLYRPYFNFLKHFFEIFSFSAGLSCLLCALCGEWFLLQ
jgi:hypothetical protein